MKKHPPLNLPKPPLAWRFYLSLSIVLTLFVATWIYLEEKPWPNSDWLLVALQGGAIAGLFGYLNNIRFLPRLVWILLFVLYLVVPIAQVLLHAYPEPPVRQPHSTIELVIYCTVLIILISPMLYALWQYGIRGRTLGSHN